MSMGGSSVGPIVCGAIIDWLTPVMFEQVHHSSFAALCTGGSSSTGAADLSIPDCRTAIAHSTKLALMGLALFCLWPAFHFLHAARVWKRQGRSGLAQ